MRERSRFGWVSVVALGLSMALSGCGSKEGGAASSASAASSAVAKSSAKPAESAKPAASASSAAADPGKKVDIDAILASADKTKKSGALKVDLSKIDDKDAPSLGGGQDTKDTPADEKPPEPPPGKVLEWLPAGAVEIPNPGWTKKSLEKGGMLTSPDEKVFLVFAEFTDNADGQAKIDQFKQKVELDELEWSDPVIVKLGPDALPCAIGAGSGKDHGVKVELVYGLIETGSAGHNILVIGGAQEDAAKEAKDDAEQILLNMRKAKAQ